MTMVHTHKLTGKMMYIKNIYIFVFSIILVFASIFIPVTVYNQNDLSPVLFGYPLKFVSQYQNYNPPFPWRTSFSSPLEHPTHILWMELIINIVIVYAIVWLILRQIKNK